MHFTEKLIVNQNKFTLENIKQIRNVKKHIEIPYKCIFRYGLPIKLLNTCDRACDKQKW